ncbi:ferritin [Skermania piniformis]|uniref:Ferritin n=2 Tax=Skermania pinensis TaxID=39122 RepID=A0ABX8SA01_9ACTN|nr:ferritin-like domain-containing protein [Skermania piniformis]QXQ14007.1 ferritin [Skermania piniformis]
MTDEFTAAQQYTAIAVYFDSAGLGQLARRFHTLADIERHHALGIIEFLLGRGYPVQVGGIGEIASTFTSPQNAVEFILRREHDTTGRITQLSRLARFGDDYLADRFVQALLADQVEHTARVMTLLTEIYATNGDLAEIDDYAGRDYVRV